MYHFPSRPIDHCSLIARKIYMWQFNSNFVCFLVSRRLRLGHLLDGLLPDFFRNTGFDPFVLLFGNPFTDLSVGRVTAEDVRVETGDTGQTGRQDFSHEVVVGPRERSEDEVKDEPPHGIEQESKVDSNHDAKELELCFQATNQQTTTGCVDSQDKGGNGWYSHHHDNLVPSRKTKHDPAKEERKSAMSERVVTVPWKRGYDFHMPQSSTKTAQTVSHASSL